VATLQTSLCLTTSQAWLPSQSSTLDTGSVARSRAYSTGGSTAAGRAKGNFGGAGIGGKRSQVMYVQVFLSTRLTSSGGHFEAMFRRKEGVKLLTNGSLKV